MASNPGEEALGQSPGNDQEMEKIGQLAELQKMVAMAAKGIEDRAQRGRICRASG